MKRATVCFTLLLSAAVATRDNTLTGSPVEKIVQLLKDLKSKIEADSKSEQQVFDKYACWCEETTSRKSKAIEDARDKLQILGQDILKFKGRVAVLTAEITKKAAEIASNLKAQTTATTLRKRQHTDYAAETSEMKQAIAALEKAISVLRAGSKPVSLLQQDVASSAVKTVLQALPSTPALTLEHVSLLSRFMRATSDVNYAPQSMTVQGILTDMYDTFTNDLESATQTEGNEQREYEDLMFTLDKDLKLLRSIKQKKEGQRADKAAELARTAQSYDDMEGQMKADIKFFDETKAACIAKNGAWKTRSDLRNEEQNGISQALNILTSDEARELFAKSIKPGKETHVDQSFDSKVSITSFLQLGGTNSADEPVARAYAILRTKATQAHSLRLAALAMQIHEAKVGHFDKVIVAIDSMVAVLHEEGASDIAKKNQCVEEYYKVRGTVANVEWLIKNNEAKISKLEGLIEKRNAELTQTVDRIAEVTQEMVDMTAQRQEEHQAFLQTKVDDQEAIKLLMSAKTFLESYFKRNNIDLGPIQGSVKGLTLVQGEPEFEVSPDQTPDMILSGKGKRKYESKGIIQLMTMIIEDANDEIKSAMGDEVATQLEFEKRYKAATDLKASLVETKTNLETTIAERQGEKDAEDTTMSNNKVDLKDEVDYKAQIKPDCDWIIGAFEKRQKARTSELDGLGAAKDYLVGANTAEAALLEEKPKGAFDDTVLPGMRFLGLK